MATTKTIEEKFNGTGSQTVFPFTIEYLDTSDLRVYVNNVLQTETTHYSISGSDLTFVSAPVSGTLNVKINRSTGLDKAQAVYAAGSSVRSIDLNNNQDQVLFALQERIVSDSSVLIGGTTPVNPLDGDRWFDTVSGRTFVYYEDADSSQWVEASPAHLNTAAPQITSISDAQVVGNAGINSSKLSFKATGTSAVSRTVDNKLKDIVSVKDFGAVGDGITNDTAAIEAALTYWASIEGATLVFPEGLYLDAGGHVHALGDKQFNSIKMLGRVRPTNTTGECWQISGVENVCLDLRVDGGGTLGDFTNATPIGGSTFLKMHTVRWGKIYIEAMNYAGRVVYFTAGGTDQATRCRMLDVNIKTGNRNVGASDEPVGQPFFVDSGSCVQTGAIGKFAFRGEGCYYGPVFERLNDIDITNLEAGKFITKGIEVRGCVNVYGDTIFIGETDAAGGANTAGIKFITSAAGRLCSRIYIDKLSCLNTTDGLYCSGFDATQAGIIINALNVETSTRAVHLINMPSVMIHDLSGKNLTQLVSTSGSCGDIDIKVSRALDISQDVFYLNSTQSSFKISGTIRGGASGYSLINILQGEGINLIDLHLQSSVCTQLINIVDAGAPNIRQVGGSVSGTSSVYTSGKRLKYVENVAGLQTFANGEATFLSGQSTVTINTGLDLTPQVISVIGIDPEVAAIYLTSVSGSNITVAVASAVTGNRLIYWTANSIAMRSATL